MSKVKILLYCTKGKPYLWQERDENNNKLNNFLTSNIFGKIVNFLNGKIVAECECEKVDYYQMEYHANNLVMNDISIYDKVESEEWGYDCFNRVISNEYSDEEIANYPLLKKSCLTFDELGSYVCPKGGVNNFYTLYLSNVKVLNNPLQFEKNFIYKDYKSNELITKAPQNMCNVYDRFGNHYILISIQPQHLVNILNGKKTIEIRKSILNLLKETM
ncbi:MAG: hypothetical protein J6J11_07390 [Treponema sp.]|nr:hypothetical protein [Treponema sp.]